MGSFRSFSFISTIIICTKLTLLQFLIVGLYFNKIQCFCFEEQRLLPGETVDMPVFFFIDPEIMDDPGLKHVNNVTLSYTFFQTDMDYDDDEEDEEDEDEVEDKAGVVMEKVA